MSIASIDTNIIYVFLGKDVMAKARTGTGKTVAFLVRYNFLSYNDKRFFTQGLCILAVDPKSGEGIHALFMNILH